MRLAPQPEPWDEEPDQLDKRPADGTLRARSIQDVESLPTQWLIDGKFPLGYLSLIYGPGGLGKSMLVIDLVARATRGVLPGDLNVPANVIILASEDSPAATIRPRLEAAEAELSRVYIIETYDAQIDEWSDSDNPLIGSANELKALAQGHDVKLIVVDALADYMGPADQNDNGSVRKALGPIRKIAKEQGAAIIGISHHNKAKGSDPRSRSMGSVAFYDTARAVAHVIQDPQDESARLFGMVKNNGAPIPDVMEQFTITKATNGTGRIKWIGERDGRISDALSDLDAQERSDRGAAARTDAQAWLEAYLRKQDGPSDRPQVIAAGQTAGHTESTLKRAAGELGVITQRGGNGLPSTWQLPAQSDQSDQF